MPRKPRRRSSTSRRRAGHRRAQLVAAVVAAACSLGRGVRALRRKPLWAQAAAASTAAVVLSVGVNWTYQVARKPSELFFPVSGRLHKTPSQTWRTYGPLFRRHSTAVISPELLAAFAQVEALGNPIARTYWRWSWSRRPFEIYRPASSSVGMYQMTDGTFAEARRYCIHRHVVVEQGPWHAWRSCWFNNLYTRVIPSHAVELTSANLDRRVAQILERSPAVHASITQQRDLAAVIHLCGATGGLRWVRADFPSGWRCGSHDLDAYLSRVRAMRRLFERMSGAAEEENPAPQVTHAADGPR